MHVSLQLDKWIRLDVVKTLTIRTSHQALVTVCVCNSPCLLRPVSRQPDTTLRQRDPNPQTLIPYLTARWTGDTNMKRKKSNLIFSPRKGFEPGLPKCESSALITELRCLCACLCVSESCSSPLILPWQWLSVLVFFAWYWVSISFYCPSIYSSFKDQ